MNENLIIDAERLGNGSDMMELKAKAGYAFDEEDYREEVFTYQAQEMLYMVERKNTLMLWGLDLSVSERNALVFIAQGGVFAFFKNLVMVMDVYKGTVKQVLKRLEKRGLVVNLGCSGSGAGYEYRLTLEGRKMVSLIEKREKEYDGIMMEGFSEEEKGMFTRIVRRIAQNMIDVPERRLQDILQIDEGDVNDMDLEVIGEEDRMYYLEMARKMERVVNWGLENRV